MPVTTENANTHVGLTDEHIADIQKTLEMNVPKRQYWAQFTSPSIVKKGHKTFQYRRLVDFKVKPEDVKPAAELVAPRPTKYSVETFERELQNYRNKAQYSREAVQYNIDDVVLSTEATLESQAIQELDVIIGTPFTSSRAIVEYDTSILKTLENAAIIFMKNKVVDRWDRTHFLAHVTPEVLAKIRAELVERKEALSEPTKEELDRCLTATGSWGDWLFSVTTTDNMYVVDEDGNEKQYIVLQGRRKIDGTSPVTKAKLEGTQEIEVIHNPLGSGVLVDVDGNISADDNKQAGSVAINIDGLGADVNDDLCLLNCLVDIAEIKGTYIPEHEKTNFKSISGNEIELAYTKGTNTDFVVTGVNHINGKDYAYGSTILKVQVKAQDTKTLGAVTTANWSATYETDKKADILSVIKTVAANDTIIVQVPHTVKGVLTIACTATAS